MVRRWLDDQATRTDERTVATLHQTVGVSESFTD